MLENLVSHRLRRYGVLFLAGIVAVVGVRLIVSLIISAGGGTEPLYESSAHRIDRLSSATRADLWVAVWNPGGPEGPLAVGVEWYGAADPLAPVNKTPRQIGLRGVHVVAGNYGGNCCPNAVTTTHCTNLLPVVYGNQAHRSVASTSKRITNSWVSSTPTLPTFAQEHRLATNAGATIYTPRPP